MKPILPTQPIKKAFIQFNGDPSVGIVDFGYEIEIHFDVNNYDQPEKILESIRQKIDDLYEFIEGEPPSCVMFDFELELMNKIENDLTENLKEMEFMPTWCRQ